MTQPIPLAASTHPSGSRDMPAAGRGAAAGTDKLRADKRVEFVDDERPMGGNIIVTMTAGWTLDPRDLSDGVFGADTLSEAWVTLRRAVQS